MLQPTRRDGQMRSSTTSIPWLREVIAGSLPPDAGDDEVLTVDILLTTAPAAVSSDVLMNWVVDHARAFGLASVEGPAVALVTGVTCWRAPDGTARSSIAQRHEHYAPTGFDWGFGGSGPADLALNMLALFLPLAPEATGVVLRDGSFVSEAAWALHHECKYDLIATLPRSGGHITAETIRTWITTHPIFPADPLLRPLEHLDGGPHVAHGG
jgi:hypothetical protein